MVDVIKYLTGPLMGMHMRTWEINRVYNIVFMLDRVDDSFPVPDYISVDIIKRLVFLNVNQVIGHGNNINITVVKKSYGKPTQTNIYNMYTNPLLIFQFTPIYKS